MIRQIPELADGGYWYVCEVIEDAEGIRPDIPDVSFCAQYGNTHAIVRVLSPLPVPWQATRPAAVISEAITVGSLLSDAKPYMRIGGQ